MLSWSYGALGALSVLLIQTRIKQQIETLGWAGVFRIFGNLAIVLYLVHLVFITAAALLSVVTYIRFGYPPPMWPWPVHPLGLPLVLFQYGFLIALVIFKRNLVLVVSALCLWAFDIFSVYAILNHPPGDDIHYVRWLSIQIDMSLVTSFNVAGTLTVLAVPTYGLMLLYRGIARTRQHLEAQALYLARL